MAASLRLGRAADPERQARAVQAIHAAHLDGLVCASASEVLLLSGYWPVMASSVVVATADAGVTVIVPEDELELAEKTSWASLVPYKPAGLKTLASPVDLLRPPLADVLNDLHLGRAHLGLQLGHGVQPASYAVMTEYRSSLPALLGQLLPQAQFQPCDELLEEMKAVKTDRELGLLSHACAVASAGFAAAADAISAGKSEVDVAAAGQAAFDTTPKADHLERSYGYFYCMSGPNAAKASAACARTRRRVIEAGDLVMIHANTCADGHWTDITRTYTAGTPTEHQREVRAAIDEAHASALQTIKPGVTGSDVDHAARSVMQARGFGKEFKHATGHGVGFAAANPNGRPRIHPLSPDVLSEGMTFNVEPAAYFDGVGGMRHCDVVAVTKDGARVLTQF
jgi:Xaa-Pro aminopeptidase